MRERNFIIRRAVDGSQVSKAIAEYFSLGKSRPLSITMKMQTNTRSLEQNSKIHAMIGHLAREIGDSQDAVKEEMIARFAPKILSQLKDKNGEKTRYRPKRTHEMSTAEMRDFITHVEVILAEYGGFGLHGNENYS